MIKVECPSCRAPYELDERRIPQGGMNMRCPKCSTSFRVGGDGTAAAVAGASVPVPKKTIVGVAPPPPPAKASASAFGQSPAVSSPPAARPAPPAPPPVAPASPYKPPTVASRAPARPPSSGGFDLELPAPAAPSPPAPVARPAPASPPVEKKGSTPFDEWGETDLPTPKIAADLPAPKASPHGAFGGGDATDLPAVKGSTPKPAPGSFDDHLDLPAPKRPSSPTNAALDDELSFDLDLPRPKAAVGPDLADLPRPAAPRGAVDLPAPKPMAASGFEELDLPMPKGVSDLPAPRLEADDVFGDLDLPMPKLAVDLPVGKGAVDLPVGKGAIDLPVGRDAFDAPAARGAVDVPSARRDGGIDLPIVQRDFDLPHHKASDPTELALDDLEEVGGNDGARPPAAADFSELDLELDDDPKPRPSPRAMPVLEDMGELDLGEHEPATPSGSSPGRMPSPVPAGASPDGRAGAGSTNFGELDLGDSTNGVDGLEFDALPQDRTSHVQLSAAEAMHAGGAPEIAGMPDARRYRRAADEVRAENPMRKVLVPLAALLVVAAAGAGLGATPYGFFGIYFFEQFLPGSGSASEIARVLDKADALFADDTWEASQAARIELGAARKDAGLNRALLSRSLLHEAYTRVRFGESASDPARIASISARLEERGGDAPHMALARAAVALAQGNTAATQQHLTVARSQSPGDVYVLLLEGELALRQGKPDAAMAAFQKAVDRKGGARAQWGLSRALLAAGSDDAEGAIDATIAASPRHAEARLEKARRLLARGARDEAVSLLRQVVGAERVANTRIRAHAETRAAAWSALGGVYESENQRGRAAAAYAAALKADGHRADALLGSGRVLLQERRFVDALARFRPLLETAKGAGSGAEDTTPEQSLEALLGATRAMLELDRVPEAVRLLGDASKKHANDARVFRALGQAQQAARDHHAAEKAFREAIRLAPDVFEGYFALAELYLKTERAAEAALTLEDARRAVAPSSEMHRLLAESELARGNFDAAIVEAGKALALNNRDSTALFVLGMAQRRAGRLADAATSFDRLAERDPSYPGLAVERGRVHEAQGQPERAVESYQRALDASPDDLDLKLRLGTVLVVAGRLDQAEKVLDQVLEARPQSAEATHFRGRIPFARGEYSDALRYFERALSLNSDPAEYHLYVAWAQIELGALGRAFEPAEQALTRDPSLGDAYWIRGRLRLRSGAVQDALRDFEKARALNPERKAVLASMAESYDQLGRRDEAIRAYQQAVEFDPTKGEWWYRLGRLLADRGRRDESLTALTRSIVLGEDASARPGWLVDAHRAHGELSRQAGRTKEAITSYRRYLELAPPNAVDRNDVQRQLLDMGAAL